MAIHPTAIIGKGCEIDPTAEIGPYAILEPGVRIGAATTLYAHAYISQGTTLGQRCAVHPFAVIGHHPQDLKWKNAPSYTVIGDDCVFREGCQVHRGTAPESTTKIGDRVYMMANAHVGHNSEIGSDAILANAALVSGHVSVGERTFISGCALVHQFVRIGAFVMIGGGVRVTTDVPHYMMVAPLGVIGPNVVGLRRSGFTPEQRREIRIAYKTLYRAGLSFPDAVERVAQTVRTDAGRRLVEFLRAPTLRGFMRWKARQAPEPAEIIE